MSAVPIALDEASFRRGVCRACAGTGIAPDFVMKMAEFGALSSCLGDGFVKGAGSFLSRFRGKRDGDEYEVTRKRSFLRRMLPWAVALGGGALALKYGDMWGRHAAATGDNHGPVSGTLKAIAEAATGQKFKYVGRGNIVPRDNYHAPMSNDQYNNLVTYGTKEDPSLFDTLGDRPNMPR